MRQRYWKYDDSIKWDDDKEQRTSIINIRLDERLKNEFKEICKVQEIEMSEQIRTLIYQFILENN